jgi:hypothetical protein
VVYLAGLGWSIAEAVKELLRCNALDKAIFVTKPSIVTVWGPNKRVTQLAVPPSSIVLNPEASESCHFDGQGFTVAEDAWIDGKAIPSKNSLTRKGKECPIAESLEEVFGKLGTYGRCSILCGGSLGELVKTSLNPVVADLSTFEEVEGTVVCGILRTLWRSHPVLYGLNTANSICLNVAKVDDTVLKHYIKTMAYIGDRGVLYEIPYSNSILFAGYDRQLLELAVRAVIYSC